MEIRITTNIAISAWEDGKKIGHTRHFFNVGAEIPRRVRRVCNIIGEYIADETTRKDRSPEDWADIINTTIANEKLKAWVGSIVYWDYCHLPEDESWKKFKHKIVEKYDFNHTLTEKELCAGLRLVGYNQNAGRKRIVKDDERFNRFIHQLLKKHPLVLTIKKTEGQ